MLSNRRSIAIAAAVAAGVAAYFGRRAYMGNQQAIFYVSLVVFALALWVLVRWTWARASQALRTATQTFAMIAVLLPIADYVYRRQAPAPIEAAVEPAYSFRAAQANPQAFRAWWAHYVNEWTKKDGGKAATEMPDPRGVLPFVMVPGSSGRFFDSVIRVNSLGFRGGDIARDKGDRYRIFVIGESPTFGATLRPGERPWPDWLQSLLSSRLRCDRPIEVINAGVEAYTLRNNIERLRRDILPLSPDLAISYHGYNGLRPLGLLRTDREEPQRRARPSALIGEAGYRIQLAIHRWRRDSSPEGAAAGEADSQRSAYADLYREFVGLGRAQGFRAVLASSSMAVNGASLREVRDFYGAVFLGVDGVLAANAAHNRMVARIAADEAVDFIDTTPGLDGVWDDDLYVDLVHFTDKGSSRIAQIMFDGLAPILRADRSLNCVGRE